MEQWKVILSFLGERNQVMEKQDVSADAYESKADETVSWKLLELDDINDHSVLYPEAASPLQSTDLSQAPNSISLTMNCSQWEKWERIGGGRFGIVHVAINRETLAFCALKEISDIGDPQSVKSLTQEIQVLSQLKHPNVVGHYGSEIVGSNIFLYMEYVQPGSMKKYIRARGALQEPLVRHFTAQILSGLAYLHSQRVVHRDIKADNLLVDYYDVVKLADFGLAKQVDNCLCLALCSSDMLDLSVGIHSERGTPYWTAPELFEGKKYNSSGQAFAVDIWSLGCTVIEMLTGKHPWHGLEAVNVIFRICSREENPPIPQTLSPDGEDFLKCCFTRNPAERPSAKALLEHSFVKNMIYTTPLLL